MRLLQYNSDGNFSLTEFFNKVIPEYAILSQRWETEKAKFEDLQKEIGTKEAGYKKLQFCKEQARGVALKHFWVDTCCIDKSSSTELAEALNSMYRWCRDAARCYVCLLDVSVLKQKAGDTSTKHTYTSKAQCYSRMLDCKMQQVITSIHEGHASFLTWIKSEIGHHIAPNYYLAVLCKCGA